MCGESRWPKRRVWQLVGSSPRVWGKPDERFCINLSRRVIPTCVGKALARLSSISPQTGHPHVCGESVGVGGGWVDALGSSPRVWGKRSRHDEQDYRRRVIPTCVGKAATASAREGAFPGHPHVCGESRIMGLESRLQAGSSPRVWGKQ